MRDMTPDDPRPPFRQLEEILRAAIAEGELKGGDKLPSLNELAVRYDLSPATVQQAIRPLKRDGLVRSKAGSGFFVEEVSRHQDMEREIRVQKMKHADARLYYFGTTGEPLLKLFYGLPDSKRENKELTRVHARLSEPMTGLEEAFSRYCSGHYELRLYVDPVPLPWAGLQTGDRFFLSTTDESGLLDPAQRIVLTVPTWGAPLEGLLDAE